MLIKSIFNYSPNFSPNKRPRKVIKYIIFHYTGMKSEKSAIERLTSIQSEVSAHYFIKKNGSLITLVPDSRIAWHAGKSKWKNKNLLNNESIGIEITNPGHEFGYKKFSKKQIKSLISLCNFLIKKYKIKKKNILGHSDISPDRKKDPGEKFPWQYLAKNNIGLWHSLKSKDLKKVRRKICNESQVKKFKKIIHKIGYRDDMSKNVKASTLITKAFQRRYRPELIDGKIDLECYLICKNLSFT